MEFLKGIELSLITQIISLACLYLIDSELKSNKIGSLGEKLRSKIKIFKYIIMGTIVATALLGLFGYLYPK
ncbi:hypothetical protein QQ008_22525 [Fulvivirgaceae bacterium BMA10]|uniref:Protein-export membrane protein SecG n=1 Tax=Splendidivirga corallicola TaxID=3051826 RepID=A0ABT8KTU8_9BACT|nr:hypothetical protein [Fulvivirgaceae bacterium BMA10]